MRSSDEKTLLALQQRSAGDAMVYGEETRSRWMWASLGTVWQEGGPCAPTSDTLHRPLDPVTNRFDNTRHKVKQSRVERRLEKL
jgi:hypothetical protein